MNSHVVSELLYKLDVYMYILCEPLYKSLSTYSLLGQKFFLFKSGLCEALTPYIMFVQQNCHATLIDFYYLTLSFCCKSMKFSLHFSAVTPVTADAVGLNSWL